VIYEAFLNGQQPGYKPVLDVPKVEIIEPEDSYDPYVDYERYNDAYDPYQGQESYPGRYDDGSGEHHTMPESDYRYQPAPTNPTYTPSKPTPDVGAGGLY
jgi:hypothetical protein